MTFAPFIKVEVFENDGLTLIAELPRRWNVQGSEPLNVPGVGSITVDSRDAVVTRHPGIFDPRNVVKFWLGDGLGNGAYVTGFRIRQRVTSFVSDGEWAGFVTNLSGPTVHADLDMFMVKHEVEPTEKSSDSRAFSWTSKDGEWYDAADWADVWVDNPWTNPSSNRKEDNPTGWPDRNALWLYGGGSPWEFWRTTVTLPADKVIRFFFSSDENGKVYLNGDEIISTDTVEIGYTEMSKYTCVMLGDIEHTIAVRSHGVPQPLADGSDEFIFTMGSLNAKGELDRVYRRSDDTNWVLHENLPPPGWTKAQILKLCIEEAQTRSNDFADGLTLGFTGLLDSDANAWTDEISRTVQVGTTVLDLQSQLSEHGSFDVWVDPDTMTVEAWIRRGSDKTSSITLEPGRNLLSWTIEENDDIRNKVLGRHAGGWNEIEDATSVTNHGAREAVVVIGSVADSNTADVLLEQIMANATDVVKKAGTPEKIRIDEDTKPDGGLIAVLGAVPMLDFGVGDTVSALNAEAVLAEHYILALSIVEDNETGSITWDPELYEVLA